MNQTARRMSWFAFIIQSYLFAAQKWELCEIALRRNGMLWVRTTRRTKELGPKPGRSPEVLRTPTSLLTSRSLKSRLTLYHEPRSYAISMMGTPLFACQNQTPAFEYKSHLAPTKPLRMNTPTQVCSCKPNQWHFPRTGRPRSEKFPFRPRDILFAFKKCLRFAETLSVALMKFIQAFHCPIGWQCFVLGPRIPLGFSIRRVFVHTTMIDKASHS